MRDRMEWAQQQRKREEERIAVIRAKDKELKEKKEKEAKMAKEFVQELFSLNPEWEERRRRVHQVCRCDPEYNLIVTLISLQ
jgi:hypothetical protein